MQGMRIGAGALLRWAALVAACYIAGIAAWFVVEPVYLAALAAALRMFQSIGLLPPTSTAVPVSGLGLAVLIPQAESLAIPQRILGADLALTVALVAGSRWLTLRRRAIGIPASVAFVFAAHLATILAQHAIATGASPTAHAAWSLWTTLYQGKIVPVLAWVAFLIL